MSEIKKENRFPHDYTHVTDSVGATEEVRSTVTPADSIGSTSFIEVSLNERLADNPLSVRHSVSELDGLEASIRVRGILQPLIVARAEVFRLACPGTSVDSQAEWVLLAGHRRRAAACRAGIRTAIAIVRDDLVKSEDSATTVALIENVHRAGLSPLEESRALSVLRDLGLSQRDISDQTGISQGQVSKRLQLLELPIELQDCIEDGGITVADALAVLHELNDRQDQLRALRLSQGGGRSLKRVLSQLKREQIARNFAEPRPGEEDTSEKGAEKADHDDSSIPAEQQQPEGSASTAVIEPRPAHEGESSGHRESQEVRAQHAAACSARVEACRRAVQSRLSIEQIADVLVDATLDPPVLRSTQAKDQAHSMATEWAANILPKNLDVSIPYKVFRSTREDAQRLAVAIVFAHREIDLASAERVLQPWHEAARRHVRRLAAWGLHTPTAYEDTKLTESSGQRGA